MEYTNVYNETYIKVASAPIIYPRLKIEILDHNENAISEITQNISRDSTGAISINYQQGVRRSCSITLIDDDGTLLPKSENGIFWINRKFKLYVGLATRRNIADPSAFLWESDDTSEIIHTDTTTDLLLANNGISTETDTYWFSQGVFYITNPSAMRDFSKHTVTINGVDKFGFLGSELGYNQLASSYVIEAGAVIYDIIKEILSLDIGNGLVVDPTIPILDPAFSSVILPYDINKSPGSYFGEIIIELAKILGADVFYDTDGRLNIVGAAADISYAQKSAIWEYTDVLPEYSGAQISFDFVNAINVVKVVSDNVNGAVLEYTAENNNPLSPTRIELIGKKIHPIINSSYVFDQSGAKDYAEYILNTKSIIQTKLDFSSSLLPHLDVNNVVGITDTYFDFIRQRFIIQSLNIPLDTSSLISVSASNISDLPFYDT